MLPPGCFGMVMASGIISVAAQEQRHAGVSAALAIMAAVAWVGLVGLSAARVVLAADLARGDLESPARRFDLFTVVAATDVLGVRAAVAGWDRIGVALLLLGALAWLALAVTLPMAMRRRGPTPAWWAASGNWLLAVVATQSLAVLTGTLARPGRPGPLPWLALSCWGIGLALYAALIVAIAGRPDSWTAGARRGPDLGGGQFGGGAAGQLHLRGLLRDRAARRYQTRWWAAVFPLGMYSVATEQLAATLGMRPLESLARVAFWVALGAWSLTAARAVGSARWSIRPSI